MFIGSSIADTQHIFLFETVQKQRCRKEKCSPRKIRPASTIENKNKNDEKKNKTQDNFKPFIDIEYNKLITYNSQLFDILISQIL
jgi:hypothetical protein